MTQITASSMKHILIIAIILAAAGCKEKEKERWGTTRIVSGSDTVEISGHYSIDLSACHASSGRADTAEGIMYIHLDNSFQKDTILIHDTVYTARIIEHADVVNIDQR